VDISVHGSSDEEEHCGRAAAQINACGGYNALCVERAPRCDLTLVYQSKKLRLAPTDVLRHLLCRDEALLCHKPPTFTKCSDAPIPGGCLGDPQTPTAEECELSAPLGAIGRAIFKQYSTTELLVRDEPGEWEYFSSFEDFSSRLCDRPIAKLEPYFEREMTCMPAAL